MPKRAVVPYNFPFVVNFFNGTTGFMAPIESLADAIRKNILFLFCTPMTHLLLYLWKRNALAFCKQHFWNQTKFIFREKINELNNGAIPRFWVTKQRGNMASHRFSRVFLIYNHSSSAIGRICFCKKWACDLANLAQ